MSCACGCCDGLHAITPLAIDNRPGLSAIRTRIGTHASFLETMLARLASPDFPELAALRTRDPGDPAIAMLDAWATVADVLCFYQERIANEGYLRTATERRSLVELARLIGYVPRPGVAASVFLAFALEKDAAPVVIPTGTKANSIPNPGETMQAFETSEDLPARFEWNAIRPRLTQPQTPQTVLQDGLFLKGTATKLKRGDMLLIGRTGASFYAPIRVATVEVDEEAKRTRVTLAFPNQNPNQPPEGGSGGKPVLDAASLEALRRPKSRAPRGRAQLERSVASSFSSRADTLPRLLADFDPALANSLYPALRNAGPSVPLPLEVYAMRIEARPFGHNAPLKLTDVGNEGAPPTFSEWQLNSNDNTIQFPFQIALDAEYDVAADTRVLIERADLSIVPLPATATIRRQSLAAFGLLGKSLVISWGDEYQRWLGTYDDFSMVRGSRVYLGSEKLELADAPITGDVFGDIIELDGLYEGLDPGRWLIIEGERTDIPDGKGDPIPGIRATELVMLSGVEQTVRITEPPEYPDDGDDNDDDDDDDDGNGSDNIPGKNFAASTTVPSGSNGGTPDRGPQAGDTYHSVLTLAASAASGLAGLAYRYKRDTVTIYANVAQATHGETRTEILGSGNAAQPLQSFLLRQPPLTFVSARTPSGIASTLEVRVNDVLWHEVATLAVSGPADRKFTTKTGDDDKTAVTFGNGRQGMRLPTGRENVKARYRSGIGAPGNVAARQISLLASRPLGVKEVINPIRASGGADREGAEAIRRNAPIAIMALDRLLSISDYADFARAFGGIGKASAWRTGNRVTVVVAGVDDAPIDESSDLFVNLEDALHRFGDPLLPLTLKVRERRSIVVQAGVRLDSDYLWEAVEPRIRAAMLATFGFDSQELGAPVFLSHAFRAIQRIRGVVSVDIDVFDAIAGGQLVENGEKLGETLNQARPRINVAPHEIAWLSPAVPETLILQELPS
ncbi:putative baseplate assembly protein [Sphingomonas psychrotolerans]|uniref:Baseplate assembly protein n=1 Tax=Sphingomonas psychrotolerans TaxID=1327635 RepID=A0ABU3N8P5_9SPHN|nr:putative baseplate assembly protein [Sphingomonas psychrotolerans]MDT8760890.1 putative baseplate assembly protein [Sphingomonas psychrotolerans]